MLLNKLKYTLKHNKLTKGILNVVSMIRWKYINAYEQKALLKKGFYNLSLIHECFSKANVKYFIDFGTLLGMIREGGFIKHDTDIDIGIIADEKFNKTFIRRVLIKNGFKLLREFVYKDEVIEETYLLNGIRVDMGYYKNNEINSKWWICYPLLSKEDSSYSEEYSYVHKMNIVEVIYSKISTVETICINNVKMNVPEKVEKILEEKYGENWKIPDKKWLYWEGPTSKPCNDLGYCIEYK